MQRTDDTDWKFQFETPKWIHSATSTGMLFIPFIHLMVALSFYVQCATRRSIIYFIDFFSCTWFSFGILFKIHLKFPDALFFGSIDQLVIRLILVKQIDFCSVNFSTSFSIQSNFYYTFNNDTKILMSNELSPRTRNYIRIEQQFESK